MQSMHRMQLMHGSGRQTHHAGHSAAPVPLPPLVRRGVRTAQMGSQQETGICPPPLLLVRVWMGRLDDLRCHSRGRRGGAADMSQLLKQP